MEDRTVKIKADVDRIVELTRGFNSARGTDKEDEAKDKLIKSWNDFEKATGYEVRSTSDWVADFFHIIRFNSISIVDPTADWMLEPEKYNVMTVEV